jgi:hypothetical protein
MRLTASGGRLKTNRLIVSAAATGRSLRTSLGREQRDRGMKRVLVATWRLLAGLAAALEAT